MADHIADNSGFAMNELRFCSKRSDSLRQHLDEDEFIDLKAYTLEELKEKIFSGEIEDSKTIAALLAYETKYRKTE